MHLIRFSLVTLLVAAMPARGVGQDPVELRWRGKAGDVMRYRMTQKQTIGMSMMPQPTESESAFVFRQEVKELSSEGVGSLELEYEAVRLEVGGLQSMSYDSTRKGEETKKNDPDLAAVFEPILGARIRMKIDPTNHVVEVEGLKEVMEEAFDNMKAPDGGDMFKQLFNEENLRRMVEVNTFPEQALAEGDTWERTLEVEAPLLGTMKLSFENELLGIEKRLDQDCAKIGITGEIEIEGGEESPMHFSVDDSDVWGTMFFALESGYLVESSLKTSMALGMSIGGGEGDAGDGTQMQLSLENETRMLRIGEDDPFFE